MKVLLFVVFVLIASSDGFAALYSLLQRTVWKRHNATIAQNYPQYVCVKLLDMLDVDILRDQFEGMVQPSYPKVVRDNRGRTGRGNPHLTRNRYIVISSVDAQIERIISKAYD